MNANRYWKQWHRELAGVLGLDVVDTRVTLAKAQAMRERLSELEAFQDRAIPVLRRCLTHHEMGRLPQDLDDAIDEYVEAAERAQPEIDKLNPQLKEPQQ